MDMPRDRRDWNDFACEVLGSGRCYLFAESCDRGAVQCPATPPSAEALSLEAANPAELWRKTANLGPCAAFS
jgi:hypothetical protein